MVERKTKSIRLVVYGNKLGENEIELWNNRLKDYGLEETELNIQQGVDDSDLRHEVKNLTDLYVQNQKIISSRDESIREKENKIKLLENELKKFYDTQIPFVQLSKEAQINYTGLKEISFANVVKTNFNSVDTIAVFNTT